MIDQELLKACVVNPCSVTPRMMLIDSMIESGYSEAKALEAFEPPQISRCLPSTYGFGNGDGDSDGYGISNGGGNGSGYGYGVGFGNGSGGTGYGVGSGSGSCFGRGNGSR